MEPPETLYAKTADGLSIAYQVLGEGPPDIVLLPAFCGIEVIWEEPSFARALQRLARIGRLICLDLRGIGASDAVPLGALPTAEVWMQDIEAVIDAVGSERAFVVANAYPGLIAMLFAATYPERTAALVLLHSWSNYFRDENYPLGLTRERWDEAITLNEGVWGSGATISILAPSRAEDALFLRWAGRYERESLSPSAFGAVGRWIFGFDMRPFLPSVRVPTLVLHREGNTGIFSDLGRDMSAAHVFPTRSTRSFRVETRCSSPKKRMFYSTKSRNSLPAPGPQWNTIVSLPPFFSPTSSTPRHVRPRSVTHVGRNSSTVTTILSAAS